MEVRNMHELFVMHLKDLYSAENQLMKALPKMAEKATNENLSKGFEEHLKQTEEHIKRIEQIAESLDFSPGGHSCLAMKGLIEEGSEVLKLEGDESVIDAALIAAAQKVEHYEIAAYGTAREMAKLMGHSDEEELLNETLEEEKETDEKLNEIAKEEVNTSAPMMEE